jgi:GMP synthase-like glutamine amidotransferase
MKRALVLQHMNHDHPGRFLDFWAEDGVVPEFVRLFEGQEIPPLAAYDLMFVLGGAQDTWEEDKHSFLAAEKLAIREWVWDRAKPYFGVCLGHQLLATALGGDVAIAPVGEIGVCSVSKTEDGNASGLLVDVPATMKVMQWHFAEVTRAPQGSRVLAHSDTTAVQSLAVDSHALSTQFHCEFSPQTVAGWSSMPNYIDALERAKGPGAYPKLLAECYPLMPAMNVATRQMWNNFKTASGLIKS